MKCCMGNFWKNERLCCRKSQKCDFQIIKTVYNGVIRKEQLLLLFAFESTAGGRWRIKPRFCAPLGVRFLSKDSTISSDCVFLVSKGSRSSLHENLFWEGDKL